MFNTLVNTLVMSYIVYGDYIPVDTYDSLVKEYRISSRLHWDIVSHFLKTNEPYVAYSNRIYSLDREVKLRDIENDLPDFLEVDYSYTTPVSNSKSKCRTIHRKPCDRFETIKSEMITNWESKKVQVMKSKIKINQFNITDSRIALMSEYCKLVNDKVKNKSRAALIKRNHHEAKVEALVKEYDVEQLFLLDRLLYEKQTPYRLPSSFSPRIFNGCDQNLKSELRSIIYRGCIDIDLKRSQLALLSNFSDLNSDWLSEDIWEKIEGNKTILKRVIYACCFGGGKYSSGMPKKEVDRIYRNPLMKNLVKSVKQTMSNMTKIKLGDVELEVSRTFTARQALAYQLQYLESQLIYAAISSLGKGQYLMCCLHDGFIFKSLPQKKIETQVDKISEVINNKARELNLKNISITRKIL